MEQSKKRQIAFKAIAIVIPFLVLIILEITLRVSHYGYNTHLFIENPKQPGTFVTNTQISNLFFSNKQDARQGIRQTFTKIKSPGTYRIFVLGESSAIGYPYTQRGSFSRMLEYRLAKTFRDKNIEMINLSITAINSFALTTFANEVIEMNPDAILIYTGHNEYYGAMGVGSVNKVASNRNIIKLVICLKKLKISQLVLSLSDKVKALFNSKDQKKQEGFMQRMAGKQEIVLGSGLYNQGIEQFEANMDEILSKFCKHHIPVYLSNLVSNQREQKPFISVIKNTTDSTRFLKEFRHGEKSFQEGSYDVAMVSFLAANKIDNTYAMNNFLMGEVLYRKGDYTSADKYFLNAKELDALRFRAPEAINKSIYNLSLKYNNIYFVDAKKNFIANSTHGILDNKLFTDHLHPNLYGYFLLSDAFYNSMKKSGRIGKWKDTVSIDHAWKELPVTAVDSVYGIWMSMIMKEQWPFYEPSTFTPVTLSYPEKLTLMIYKNQMNIEIALDSLYRYYLKKDNLTEALRVVKSVDLDHPHDWKLTAEAGRINAALLNYEESVYYYKKSFAESHDIETARKIVYNLLQLDRLDELKYYLNYLIQKQPEDRMTFQLLKKTDEAITLKKLLLTDPKNNKAVFGLADYYLFIKNATEAKRYIDKARAIYPDDKRIHKLLDDYKKSATGNGTTR